MPPSTPPKTQPPFWLGGAAASLAACITHPLDQTKYRMQTMTTANKPPHMLRTLIHFAGRDGIPSLWTGISASILRQATYSTARFGLYNYFAAEARQRTGKKKLSSTNEILCAGAAGGLAGLIGNPTEVPLVRMCADAAKPPVQQFRYKHAFNAVLRIAREEGLRTFSRGLAPNVVRSILMNVSQIATYSATKQQLLSSPTLDLSDGMPTHFLASFVAGTVATTACAPADVLKSRMQNAVAVNGVRPSLGRIVTESLRKEGPRFLMRGWTPAWMRLAPNTILTFVFMEQLQKLVGFSRERRKADGVLAPASQKI
jgi:solute carrier family 25 (mitochondrial dicarboxylate transporter), member 10